MLKIKFAGLDVVSRTKLAFVETLSNHFVCLKYVFFFFLGGWGKFLLKYVINDLNTIFSFLFGFLQELSKVVAKQAEEGKVCFGNADILSFFPF